MLGHSFIHRCLRFSLPALALGGSLLLVACADFKEENRLFFGPDEGPRELRFNVAAPGYIRSPYAPDAGWVDVRGIAPGTSVICPYTGRIFVVPPYGKYVQPTATTSS